MLRLLRLLRILLLAWAASIAVPGVARAQDGLDLFSGDTLSAVGDVRIVAADGEKSWINGGDGKTRFDGNPDRSLNLHPQLAEADLIWQPRFTWSLSGTVVATAQHGQSESIDLSEAALTFKPLRSSAAKITARAGLDWPAISLEHSGPEWRVTDTITPSAINSWIGEEVKVGGVEATVASPLGSHRIAATIGAFGFNNTSGTLLAFRGWALHDEKTVAFSLQQLPPLDAFMQYAQAPRTRPIIEIDHRVGWYGKLGWSPSEAFELQAFHYDNRGDPTAVTPTLQWGWHTRFNNLGAIVSIGKLQFKAQAMGGRAEMGFPMPARIWVDTSFRSAFVLATRSFEHGSVSARIEAFGTRSRGSVLDNRYSEDGWAATAAARREIGPNVSLLAEFLHVESRRDARLALGLAPHQATNQFQLALRIHI